ncbi:MAG: cytochrome c oxidase subunit II [Hyphomicrobiales bacterium]|nr:cytochrome c oxidase subunit II [Hyphomicrobiales bacterium]
MTTRFLAAFGALIGAVFCGGAAFAAEGQPSDWQLNFQNAASPIMTGIRDFHDFLLIIITGITLFVLALLVWVMVRYNEKSNPAPSKTSHNTTVEVLWTIVPVLILVVIAIPSFRLLYEQFDFPKPDLTIKTTGHQWYWTYEYPDAGPITFDANMIDDADLKEGQPRLLATDNEVVVPVNKVVHVLVAASNVMHNWAVPAFGVKMDAIPGRVNRTWFKAERTGVFYGQCSELCGDRHAYMPITVRVVTDEEYAAWLSEAQKKFAVAPIAPAKNAASAEVEPNRLAAAASN